MHSNKIVNQLCKIGLTTLFFAFLNSSIQAQDIAKQNLGPGINTTYDETKPLISPDGKILYFARQNFPDNYKGEKDPQDIYFSMLINHEWSKAENIGEPLNDRYPNGVSSVTPDGQSILVINSYNGIHVGSGASISHKTNEGWSFPEKIQIKEFYNLSEYVDYFISSNEQGLLLAIQTEDSYGDQDLFISFKENEFEWSKPINLGPAINTEKAEFSPFLAADNKTLFFASTGHEGFGKSDIFYSKRLDDTWQNWSQPVNLGDIINSEGFEAYYTIPASGDFAYYVSNTGSMEGSKDIFKATIPYQFRPDPVLMISGKVYDRKTKQPLETVITFSSESDETEDYGLAISDIENGSYKVILPRGHSFSFLAHRDGYFPIPQFKDATNIKEYMEMRGNISLIPIEEGESIDIFTISFIDKTAEFTPQAQKELDRLAAILTQYHQLEIEVGGHTSQLSAATDNLQLSEDRAKAIVSYFKDQGIDPRRLQTKGYGNLNPVNPELYENLKTNADLKERIVFTILSTTWEPPSDIDEDGIADEIDLCPEIAGPEEGKGCPDTDGDGFYDPDDECPKTPGIEELKGCPQLEEEVAEVLKEALEGIEFESGKDVILKRSYLILDKVVDVMNQHSEYFLRISGHTDNVGNADNNLLLSHRRAQAAMQYLIDHGVDPERMEASGFGDQKPVADNSTRDGRAKNRRVEFEIIFE
ncbi:MAG: OmpA family protein [Candidatus Cyclobacteriaceae bacterium M2_1C_046]